MSSISVQPASGLTVASPVKSSANAAASASTNETAKSQSTTPQGSASVPYPSPTGSIDPATGQFVIEFRDRDSGQLDYQTPSKVQLRLYQANQARVDYPGQTPVSPVPDDDTTSAIA